MRTALGAALLVIVAAQPAAAQTRTPVQRTAQRPAPAPAVRKTSDPTASPMVLARAGQFFASGSSYKNIYGDGPVFGGEVRVPIGPGGKRFVLFADGSYRTRKGELSYTKESTTATVTAFEGGLLYRLARGRISPYLGAGAGYHTLKETSEPLGTANKGGVGFLGTGGVTVAATRHLMVDLRVKYSGARLQPSPRTPDVTFKVDVGGITAGIGLGIAF
jgi:opacity protein-like surface antigen